MQSYVLLDDQKTGISRYFSDPVDIITVFDDADLEEAFERIESHLSEGKYLAGSISYEFGYLLEPAFKELAPTNPKTPLLQFGVFEASPNSAPPEFLYSKTQPELYLTPEWSFEEYKKRFDKVQNLITAGDVYQINLTFPLRGKTKVSPEAFYAAFRRTQPGRYGGIVNLSDNAIISFSPELFFDKTGNKMRMRPMKGTRPRRDNRLEDEALLQEMRHEPKSQAENLMIVDLLRNDLSRLCEAGSVTVPELFSLETYPTLHQMTSQIEGVLEKGKTWRDIFTGLFPCGSVTGAPKIRAMEIIRDLESSSRNAYCGAIGYIAPDGTSCFNVSIRTIQMSGGDIRYDVGSGVVLDSEAEDEYRECLLKADILSPKPQGVFETFRWENKRGYVRIDAHKDRLLRGAKAYNIPCDEAEVDNLLKNNVPPYDTPPQRVRLSLSLEGKLDLNLSPLITLPVPLSVAISKHRLLCDYQVMAHKVESRDFYDGERERLNALCGADEVIFLDEDGYVSEGSFTSIFIKQGDYFLTPKAGSLLPGVLRAEMINNNRAKEAKLTQHDLLKAQKTQNLYVGNSLRGMLRANLIELSAL